MIDDGNELVFASLRWLRADEPSVAQPDQIGRLGDFDASELESLLSAIDANWDEQRPYHARRLEALLQQVATTVLRWRIDGLDDWIGGPMIDPELLLGIGTKLGSSNSNAAGHCLQILAAQGDADSLCALATAFRDDPPADWKTTALAVSPLFQYAPENLDEFFERLGSSVFQVNLVGPLLDLANYVTRRGILIDHPLRNDSPRLASLLSRFVERLSRMEEDPQAYSDKLEEIQKALADGIAITVSVCDALGLIGDRGAEGKLNQALALSHRRIQAEAAGALARMGIESGKSRLLALVADPVARLRAVAYAEELGFESEVPDEFRAPEAVAEAEMASWLAASDHFGFPPNELQLVDQRTQFWPSYEEPRACYLWRFTYRLPKFTFSNIGISGPLTHAFRANLADMPLDDIYAVYAGWQAQHDDIFEVAQTDLNESQRNAAVRLEKQLAKKQVESIQTLALTFFFGEPAVLAVGLRGNRKVCAVTDNLETILFPIHESPSSLTPELVLAIYRGRKMLRAFNASREEE